MDVNPLISSFKKMKPSIHSDAFVDISARIIGAVRVEQGASIWPMAVLRADSAEIIVSSHAAVLDLSLLEAPEGHSVHLEDYALVSHGAVVHGAQICSGALIGIRAIILEGAIISSGSIVGANSLVTADIMVPPNSLVLGTPGEVVRETTPFERQRILDQSEELYQKSLQMIREQNRFNLKPGR